jgi:type I restriction-modification system DNA methylase subunit
MNSLEQKFLNDLDDKLWKAADKLRSSLDAANYKHIVLGLIFLNMYQMPLMNVSLKIYLLKRMITTSITCLVINTTQKKNINKQSLMN